MCFSFFRFFAAPQTPRILAGEASPPQNPPLTGLAGGWQPPGPPGFFFSASDDTGAARTSGRTSGRTSARPPEPKKLSRCTSYDSEYDFTIPFFSQSQIVSVRPISGNFFERTKRTKSFRIIRKFFETFFEKIFRRIFVRLYKGYVVKAQLNILAGRC